MDGRAQSCAAAITAREPADQSARRLVGGRQESIAHSRTQTDPLRSVSQLSTKSCARVLLSSRRSVVVARPLFRCFVAVCDVGVRGLELVPCREKGRGL